MSVAVSLDHQVAGLILVREIVGLVRVMLLFISPSLTRSVH